jgi:hypothetical protein
VNVIDVHNLAAELGVASAVVLRAVADLGGEASGNSRLSAELADDVRAHLRAGGSNGNGNPLFSVSLPRTTASRPQMPTVGPAFAPTTAESRPRQQARPADPFAAAPYSLEEQLADQAQATAVSDEWRAAGLGIHDRHIIEQCERNGLTPQDLRVRVDGRTMASRLKNGESISSVKSRLAQQA